MQKSVAPKVQMSPRVVHHMVESSRSAITARPFDNDVQEHVLSGTIKPHLPLLYYRRGNDKALEYGLLFREVERST